VPLKTVCLIMCWLFSLAVLVVRGDEEKNAALLVLRHGRVIARQSGAAPAAELRTWVEAAIGS